MGRVSKSVKGAALVGCGLAAALLVFGNSGVFTQSAVAAPSAGLESSLCKAAETKLFSCSIGAKQVSVCSSGTKAEYRYGRPGKIELASTNLTFAEKGFSGGGETQITMTNKDYTYTIFDRVTRTSFNEDGRNDAAFGTGLLIRRGGKIVSTKMCSEDTPISSRSSKTLAAGQFVRH